MKLSCLKGENNMDMIAEILQTDKAAAGKLEKADMESGELLERTVKEAQELKENALKEAEAYKAQKAKEVTERINTESEKITSAQYEKTTVLDKIFEEKHNIASSFHLILSVSFFVLKESDSSKQICF